MWPPPADTALPSPPAPVSTRVCALRAFLVIFMALFKSQFKNAPWSPFVSAVDTPHRPRKTRQLRGHGHGHTGEPREAGGRWWHHRHRIHFGKYLPVTWGNSWCEALPLKEEPGRLPGRQPR